MIKGVDISTLLELERLKTKFYDNGAEGKLEDIHSVWAFITGNQHGYLLSVRDGRQVLPYSILE
jgi:hypothetical protein